MNAKRAKALRAQARTETVGLPYRTYERVPTRSRGRTRIQLGNCTRRRYTQLKDFGLTIHPPTDRGST